jgi:hypothetical protein
MVAAERHLRTRGEVCDVEGPNAASCRSGSKLPWPKSLAEVAILEQGPEIIERLGLDEAIGHRAVRGMRQRADGRWPRGLAAAPRRGRSLRAGLVRVPHFRNCCAIISSPIRSVAYVSKTWRTISASVSFMTICGSEVGDM